MRIHLYAAPLDGRCRPRAYALGWSLFSRPYSGNPGWFLFLRLLICLNWAGDLSADEVLSGQRNRRAVRRSGGAAASPRGPAAARFGPSDRRPAGLPTCSETPASRAPRGCLGPTAAPLWCGAEGGARPRGRGRRRRAGGAAAGGLPRRRGDGGFRCAVQTCLPVLPAGRGLCRSPPASPADRADAPVGGAFGERARPVRARARTPHCAARTAAARPRRGAAGSGWKETQTLVREWRRPWQGPSPQCAFNWSMHLITLRFTC